MHVVYSPIEGTFLIEISCNFFLHCELPTLLPHKTHFIKRESAFTGQNNAKLLQFYRIESQKYFNILVALWYLGYPRKPYTEAPGQIDINMAKDHERCS